MPCGKRHFSDLILPLEREKNNIGNKIQIVRKMDLEKEIDRCPPIKVSKGCVDGC